MSIDTRIARINLLDAAHLNINMATHIDADPVTKVIQTPELLELILLELPTRHLLLIQRTSTAFKATIEDSIALRRRLFFTPAGTQSGDIKQRTPVFGTHDPSKLNTTSGPVCGRYCRAPGGRIFEVNPLLSLVWPIPTSCGINSNPSGWWNRLLIVTRIETGRGAFCYQSLRLCVPTRGTSGRPQPTNAKAVDYEGASWRKMLLTQPPVWKPVCMADCATPCGEVDAEQDRGVTLRSVEKWELEEGFDEENPYRHLTLIMGEVRKEAPVDSDAVPGCSETRESNDLVEYPP